VLETIRILIWGVCLFMGLWEIAFTDPMLVQVLIPEKADESATSDARAGKGNVFEAPQQGAPALQAVYRALQSGAPPDAMLERYVGRGSGASFYLRGSDPLYDMLELQFTPPGHVEYVRFPDGDATRILLLDRLYLSHIAAFAPAHLAHPLRCQGIFLVGVGWAAFWLLPWRKRKPGEIHYGSFASYIGPVLVGTVLGGTFFFIMMSAPVSGGTVPQTSAFMAYRNATAVALLTTPLAWIFWLIALHYYTFSLLLDGDKLQVSRWWRRRTIHAQAIGAVTLHNKREPKWLRTLAAVLVVLRPRQSGAILLAAVRDNPIMTIWGRRRKFASFSTDHLIGLPQLYEWLAEKQIPVERDAGEEAADQEGAREREAVAADGAAAPPLVLRAVLAGVGIAVAGLQIATIAPLLASNLR
jgi:hypothetical protein